MPSRPRQILRSSPASAAQWRNTGGGRRAAQIAAILAAHDIITHDIEDHSPRRPTRLELLRAAWHLRFREPRIPMRPDRDLIRYLAGDYLRHRWYFEAHPEIRVFLVENLTDYARLRAARDVGVHLVGVPANLEVWQSPEQCDFYSGEPMPGSLHREAVFAGLADTVFCISREEQWFLANHGTRTDFLPYHPPAEQRPQLARIRAQREAVATGRGILAFAAGSNRRNLQGLAALAKLIRELPPTTDYHFHVGGFDTEALRDEFPAGNCTFHGALSDERFNVLLAECRATIIHQEQGAGALTRIPELLCAGVPVLASPIAARSTGGLTGVHLYHDADELGRLCATPLGIPPRPEPDEAAGRRLAATILRLDATGRSSSARP